MAQFKVLYWQDIPSQVKAWDDFDEVSVPLSGRAIAKIDQSAQQQDLTSEDDYLAQWRWSDEQTQAGAPAEVARAVAAELEAAL